MTWEQRIIKSDPRFEASNPERLLFAVCRMVGLRDSCIDEPEMLRSAWQRALASGVPVVLEVKTDPEVPPLPPHITLQQAKNFSVALAKGDPDEVGVIGSTARQVLRRSRKE